MVKNIDKSFLRQNWFIRASWNNEKNCTSRQEMDMEKGRKLLGEYRTRNREILRKKPNNTERAGRGERNAESINKNTEKEIEKS